jgi:hypothetical protein
MFALSTWKLSIKPDAEKGTDPFSVCRENSLIGIGWSYIFDNREISSKEQSYAALREEEGHVPKTVQKFLDEVRVDDFAHPARGWIRSL